MAKDYAIVPEEDVLKLKQDVAQIKRNPFQAYGSGDLIESMNNMTKAINSLIDLFKTAAEEMKFEERETETIGRRMDPLFAKIDLLVDQNQKIARGVVAVADMLERPSAREEPITLPPPSFQRQSFAPPPNPMAPPRMPSSMAPSMARPMGMPPAPAGMPMPPPPKKKGLFG